MGLFCFDLDGTLVDPLRAMVHCADLTCREFGLQGPAAAEVGRFVGFGARELFAALPGFQDPARLAEGVAKYEQHLEAAGMPLYRVYDGIPLLLTRLRRQGHRLFLVTVKPTRFARHLLHEFDLLLSFDEVFGSGPRASGRTKGEILAGLRSQGIVQSGGYLVGDRADDMEAGLANGLTPLGVTYGFGSVMELEDAGASQLFGSPDELDAWLKIRFPGSEIHDAFSLSE